MSSHLIRTPRRSHQQHTRILCQRSDDSSPSSHTTCLRTRSDDSSLSSHTTCLRTRSDDSSGPAHTHELTRAPTILQALHSLETHELNLKSNLHCIIILFGDYIRAGSSFLWRTGYRTTTLGTSCNPNPRYAVPLERRATDMLSLWNAMQLPCILFLRFVSPSRLRARGGPPPYKRFRRTTSTSYRSAAQIQR